jgi:adenylate cyclase
MGDQTVKNIARPVRTYRVLPETEQPKLVAGQPLALPDKPSIAVLPFQNMSGDPEQDYFADGVVEDVITSLSRSGWLFVIARNSSFAYKGTSPDIRRVGRELVPRIGEARHMCQRHPLAPLCPWARRGNDSRFSDSGY